MYSTPTADRQPIPHLVLAVESAEGDMSMAVAVTSRCLCRISWPLSNKSCSAFLHSYLALFDQSTPVNTRGNMPCAPAADSHLYLYCSQHGTFQQSAAQLLTDSATYFSGGGQEGRGGAETEGEGSCGGGGCARSRGAPRSGRG